MLTHAGVVVQVNLNVARDDTPERTDEVVHLARIGAADGVSDADAVDADLVDGLVDGEQVDEVAAERVFRREPDLDALALDKVDDLDRGLGDVRHILAVAELAQERRSTDDDVHAVHASLDSDPGVVHVAANVGEDFGAKPELADGLAVRARLFAGGGRGELDVLDAKRIQRLGDRDLGLGVEESVGELLALCAGR